jgi:hypothetical protein
MRAYLFLSLFTISLLSVKAQRPVKIVFDSILLRVLQNDGLLLTDDQRNCKDNYSLCGLPTRRKEREKVLKQNDELRGLFLRYFNPVSYADNKNYDLRYVFPNRTIEFLGSYLVRNNDLNSLQAGILPDFPVLTSGGQIALLNPLDGGSNFRLNYNSKNLFDGVLDAQIEAGLKSVVESKFAASGRIHNEARSSVSIAAGIFENFLGKVFQAANNKEIVTSEYFEPLYAVWKAYGSGRITRGNNKVLQSFDGICFFTNKGVQIDREINTSADLKVMGNVPGYITAKVNSEINWSKSNSFSIAQNLYHIYMFGPPQLVSVPTPEIIIDNWKKMTSGLVREVKAENSSAIIPYEDPLKVYIKFGPIVSPDMLQNIKLDEEYTLSAQPQAMKIVKNVSLVLENSKLIGNGFYLFEVQLTRNNDFLDTLKIGGNAILKVDLPFRLYVNHPVENKVLDVKYDPQTFQTEAKPIPLSKSPVNANKVGTDYNYVTDLSFDVSGSMVIANSTASKPKIIDISGLPSNLGEDLKQTLLDNYSVTYQNPNQFELRFSIPAKSKFFDVSKTNYKVELKFEFLKSGNKPAKFVRVVPMQFNLPNDLPTPLSNTFIKTISFNTNQELVEALDTSAIVKDGRKLNQLVEANTKEGKLDILGLIKDLETHANLTISPDYHYIIGSEFIDLKKLRKN